MNERSIFKISTGNVRRYANDEYPVPKSSNAIRTPCARRSASTSTIRCVSAGLVASNMLSVTSNVNALRGNACRVKISSTVSRKLRSRNCRPDTFTVTAMP
nr:hypothetical protein GCM10020093_010400 [Planobispora longispora]BFE88652.1 hypothetical protein GCM10020093_112530 [Planobispora longispora]